VSAKDLRSGWSSVRLALYPTLLFTLSNIFMVCMPAALGIGSQAIVSRTPGLPQLDDETYGQSGHLPTSPVNSVPRELPSTPPLIVETTPLKASTVPVGGSGSVTLSLSGSQRSSSALHTLMEQGGLVEIGPKVDGPPSVITRTIGDALALPTTPEEESENPTETLILPPRPSLTPPPPVSPALDTLVSPNRTPSMLEIPEIPANTARSQRSSPVSTNSDDVAVTHSQKQPQLSLRRPNKPEKTVPPGLRVLVVDDDQLTRTLMTRLLTRLGCKVSTAENGEVALEMVLSGHGGRFAVVFLDNQMPVMSGLSMVAKLREAGRNDFVVGVTGNALLSDQEEYLEAGVDRCALFFESSFSSRFLGERDGLMAIFRVLTKPVLERSLRSMLVLASERLAAS